ncbi:GAF domain-containing sensor histidine kinase [Leptolyngbya sp. FACHB-261]|nr:GAF domain-containing sensor histidine kinase [Leptolyngbya sp. FACHB-261]
MVPAQVREQQRNQTLNRLGLLRNSVEPIFEEAVQRVSRFLPLPLCLLNLVNHDQLQVRAAVGLSSLSRVAGSLRFTTNIASFDTLNLNQSRQFPLAESFCAHVIDAHQPLAVTDTLADPYFSSSLLVQQYGVRSYLGVPLISTGGDCLGTLSVMDLSPYSFTTQEVELLELVAQWAVSEVERRYLSSAQAEQSSQPRLTSPTNRTKAGLLSQVSQELRTPLTSVLGMTSVLHREVFGPLTAKQREYLDVIHRSGQDLLSLVDELLDLGALDGDTCELNLVAVDIEMLGQQILKTASHSAARRQQQLQLSIEPGCRLWVLDKLKVRQMLYHLLMHLLQSSAEGGVVQLQITSSADLLSLAVWSSDGLVPGSLGSPASYYSSPLPADFQFMDQVALRQLDVPVDVPASGLDALAILEWEKSLRLLLSYQLAELHQGSLGLQVMPASSTGFCYRLDLPQLTLA